MIPNFSQHIHYYLAPCRARIPRFLPPTMKQCFKYRLSNTIVSPIRTISRARCSLLTDSETRELCRDESQLPVASPSFIQETATMTRISVVEYTYVLSSISSAFDGAEGAARLPP